MVSMESSEGEFLEVQALLERSQPRPRVPWAWYVAGGLVLALVVGSLAGTQSSSAAALINFFLAVLMVGAMAGTGLAAFLAAKAQRAELQQVQGVDELVQLRRWQEAAGVLQRLLNAPMRTQPARIQALIYLAAVLARYHRFADAVTVQEYILEHVQLDPEGAFGLRLGRAMALLHEDRLFDADRAISDLRRSVPGRESGGLALVEIYRDVKTGHPAEAIEIFEAKLGVMRAQLGHRVGDAYALAARAYDLLGRKEEAKGAFGRGTLLAPVGELMRRYPELAVMADQYPATAAPMERVEG
jgi:tetratricopeptide (TPR) repeat protein